MKKLGRPPRKDKPQRISLNLSQRAYRQLERMSRFSPSRSAFVETLLDEALKKESK
jgi:metal-responsive CopG/Arc/MetJ family transcriptional regulator